MNLNLILALILAAVLSTGGAGYIGYAKGKTDAELVAKVAMDKHLSEDREAETKAKDKAREDRDKLADAQNAVSAAYEKGKADNVVEFKVRDGKTYVVVNDYNKLRTLFGDLLAEIQRIKSEGDFSGAKAIVENYAVKVDQKLHKEVLERYKKLNMKPYKGFVNPVFEVVKDASGKITDVKITYTEGYAEQMLRYAKEFSTLPTYN